MKGKVTQFALAAMLAVGFAAPALAQNTNWKLNSDHSTGHLSLTSTADPNATFDVGAARVKGSVSLDASPLVNSWFDFIIYPADQDPASINKDGSLIAAEFSNMPRSTVVTFRSREVKLTGDGDLAVTGDLTLTHPSSAQRLSPTAKRTPGPSTANPKCAAPLARSRLCLTTGLPPRPTPEAAEN